MLGCLGRLALSGIAWGLCWGVWGALGLLGPGSGTRPMSGWLGPGGVGGLLPLVPGGPLPYAYGDSVRGLPLLSSGWMRGSMLRGGGWWPGSCGPLCLLLIAGGGLWIVAL